eukprot:1138599-Pelagomonas_calceolata.AAC.4
MFSLQCASLSVAVLAAYSAHCYSVTSVCMRAFSPSTSDTFASTFRSAIVCGGAHKAWFPGLSLVVPGSNRVCLPQLAPRQKGKVLSDTESRQKSSIFGQPGGFSFGQPTTNPFGGVGGAFSFGECNQKSASNPFAGVGGGFTFGEYSQRSAGNQYGCVNGAFSSGERSQISASTLFGGDVGAPLPVCVTWHKQLSIVAHPLLLTYAQMSMPFSYLSTFFNE